MRSLKVTGPMLLLFFCVTVIIYTGIATPTEASAIGAIGAIVLTIAAGKLTLPSLGRATYRAALTSCMVLAIIMTAHIFGTFLALTQATSQLARDVDRGDDATDAVAIDGPSLAGAVEVDQVQQGCALVHPVSGRGRRVVQVAGHHARAAQLDLAGLARAGAAVGAGDADLEARPRPADRRRPRLHRRARRVLVRRVRLQQGREDLARGHHLRQHRARTQR